MSKIVCRRCGTNVSFENVSNGYYAVCPSHDEDLYEFETKDNTTMMKDNPTVTFTADYFTLSTVAPLNLDIDADQDDVMASNIAGEFIREQYGFNPLDFAHEISVEW